MTCYIISYDLRKQKDYNNLYEAIKSFSTWAHLLESVWVINTTQSTTDVRDFLTKHIDSDDGLFVIKSGHEAAWRGVLCKGEWLQSNL